MLSGRGLCDELITRPEESYRLCCVVVCDVETSRIGAPYIYISIYDISNLRVNVMKNGSANNVYRHVVIRTLAFSSILYKSQCFFLSHTF